jgi:catechol 2,3-dioxygenase-like lactoylglutathione lyase family enzyme
MILNGIHHAVIIPSDLNESLRVFGLLGFDTVRFDASLNSDDASEIGLARRPKARAICLQKQGVEFGMVEFIQHQSEDGTPLGEQLPVRCGLSGLSFQYDDVQSKYDELEAAGVHFLTPPTILNVPGFGPAKIAIFYGPDNVAIEIFEKL